jgi:hypothetical protein
MPTKKKQNDRLRMVAYCGLYCDLCAERTRIPQRAQSLVDSMRIGGWDRWAGDMPGFKEFWKFLSGLSGEGCGGCRAGRAPAAMPGGPPFCGIRKCARKRKIDICVYCPDWPCHRIKGLAKAYVTLTADGERLRRIGLARWLTEQKRRAQTGFCYCDIRCQP